MINCHMNYVHYSSQKQDLLYRHSNYLCIETRLELFYTKENQAESLHQQKMKQLARRSLSCWSQKPRKPRAQKNPARKTIHNKRQYAK